MKVTGRFGSSRRCCSGDAGSGPQSTAAKSEGSDRRLRLGDDIVGLGFAAAGLSSLVPSLGCLKGGDGSSLRMGNFFSTGFGTTLMGAEAVRLFGFPPKLSRSRSATAPSDSVDWFTSGVEAAELAASCFFFRAAARAASFDGFFAFDDEPPRRPPRGVVGIIVMFPRRCDGTFNQGMSWKKSAAVKVGWFVVAIGNGKVETGNSAPSQLSCSMNSAWGMGYLS